MDAKADRLVNAAGKIPLNKYHLFLIAASGLGFLANTTLMLNFSHLEEMIEIPKDTNSWLKALLRSLSSLRFLGEIPGSFVGGYIADKYALLSAFVPLELLPVFRFVLGFSMGLGMSIDTLFLMEFLPESIKERVSSLLFIFGTLGMSTATLCKSPAKSMHNLIPGIAEFRFYSVFCAAFSLASAIFRYFWRFESTTFLISKHRFVELRSNLEKLSLGKLLEYVDEETPAESPHKEEKECKFPYRNVVLLSLAWFLMTYCYYVYAYLSAPRNFFSKKPILEVFFFPIVQFPSWGLCYWMMHTVGSKWTLFGYFLLAGLAFVSIKVPSLLYGDANSIHWAWSFGSHVLCVFSFMGCWIGLYLVTSACFPTRFRSRGYAVTGLMSKISGVLGFSKVLELHKSLGFNNSIAILGVLYGLAALSVMPLSIVRE